MKLFLAAIFVTSSMCFGAIPTQLQRSCKTDAECVLWDGSCCGCAAARVTEQYGINKKFLNELSRQLKKECGTAGCIAGWANEDLLRCQALKVKCVNRLCEVR